MPYESERSRLYHIEYRKRKKPCGKCGATETLSSHLCLECNREQSKNWKQRNPERTAEIGRKSILKRKYGMTPEDAEALLASRNGKCHLCLEAKARYVDHDHESGKVRGMLCMNCNTGLGQFHDRIELLMNAILYLNGTEC